MAVREFTRTPNQHPGARVINIPGLERAGFKVHILSGADVFLQRVSEVVQFPQKVLPQLDQKAPVYKAN